MRTKTIIDGFKNSQKFRVIWNTAGGSETDVGLYMTIQQMSESMATTNARVAVWTALERLSYDRQMALATHRPEPTGIGITVNKFQVQVSLA
jgi:hypothetical protein